MAKFVIRPFPDLRDAEPGQDLVAVGGDMSPATLLEAYSRGLFPMHVKLGADEAGKSPAQPASSSEEIREVLGWWSPDPRGVLPLDSLLVSKSLAKSLKRFKVTFNQSFQEVMLGCRDARPDAWITDEFLESYLNLHELGHAHSVEVRNHAGELVGGLYGVEVGGLFAGESMFHLERDASKVALVSLVEVLRSAGPKDRLLDVQWRTDHLATLGVVAIPRPQYLEQLASALEVKPAFRQLSSTR